MQAIAPVTPTQLLAPGQEPLMKLEVYYGGAWRNICNLAGKNYLQNISLSFGGARMTPNPIAGTWNATINNVNSIFHPQHPDSIYKDYFAAGREVKITIGARYAGADHYWQRIIGYMDEPKFDVGKFSVQIRGLDYTKILADTVFKKTAVPPDNHWGAIETFNSVATAGYGGELYDSAAGDAAEIIPGEANLSGDWAVKTNGATAISSQGQIGGFSLFELEFITDVGDPPSVVWYQGVCPVVAGTEYFVTFKYARTAGDDSLVFTLYDGTKPIGGTGLLNPAVNGVFETASFYFTPSANEPAVDLWLTCRSLVAPSTWRIDNISIKSVLTNFIYRYEMPEECNGIHYVELDEGAGFLPVWPGQQKDGEEGWFYDSVLNQFYFAEGKIVNDGINNLKVYYYTDQSLENVIADLLVKADLYADRDAALAGMDYTATGFTVGQVWFIAGSSLLDAIKMICERCDYRFRFDYDGTPVFKPAPTPVAPITFIFLPHQIARPNYYQSRNEIRNRVVIEGLKQALPEGAEEAMSSELKGEVNDVTSIDDYGEHTLSIRNHLFQDQSSIDAMCTTLLTKYKDPKWYFDFNTPFNPAPLEIGDTLRCYIRLYPALRDRSIYSTFEYGDGAIYGVDGIIVIQPLLIRDIKADQYNLTYKCEKAV